MEEGFRDDETSVSRMVWPAQSPDLNPSENIWDVLEKNLHSGSTLPPEIQDLMCEIFFLAATFFCHGRVSKVTKPQGSISTLQE